MKKVVKVRPVESERTLSKIVRLGMDGNSISLNVNLVEGIPALEGSLLTLGAVFGSLYLVKVDLGLDLPEVFLHYVDKRVSESIEARYTFPTTSYGFHGFNSDLLFITKFNHLRHLSDKRYSGVVVDERALENIDVDKLKEDCYRVFGHGKKESFEGSNIEAVILDE